MDTFQPDDDGDVFVSVTRTYEPGGDLVLLALGVAFAAFAVWLTVRIVNRRERWAKWMAVALVALPVLYVVSFGPTCWMLDSGWFDYATSRAVYWPISKTIWHLPVPAHMAIEWWGTVGSDRQLAWFVLLLDVDGDVPLNPNEEIFWIPRT